MPTKQTRRSISVRGTTYDELRRYSTEHNRSMSDLVEELIAKLLDKPTVKAASQPAQPKAAQVDRTARIMEVHRKSAQVIAARIARAPVAVSAGRPAPTPAEKAAPERVAAPKGDYRTIRF